MIKNWKYGPCYGAGRPFIKEYIKENNFNTIDVGASARYWSYPECKVVVDSYHPNYFAQALGRPNPNYQDVLFFDLNIEDVDSWNEILEYVDDNDKFDFSICSHTLEDVFNPIDLARMLEKVSHRGYIAVPSKYDELTNLFGHPYRGNAHHKQIFDVVEDELVIYPKFSWIETDGRSDKIVENSLGPELELTWEGEIPIKVFPSLPPNLAGHGGDEGLINRYYKELMMKRK